MCAHGAAVSQDGAPAEGIPEIRQGLELAKMIGNGVGHAYYETFLVEALLGTGELAEAEALIDEALARCQTSLGRVHEPELWRLRATLLGARGDAPGAEGAYRQAIAMARERRALAWALRAATGLGHVLHARGADAEARALVGDALAAQNADDEADVRDARTLLAALG